MMRKRIGYVAVSVGALILFSLVLGVFIRGRSKNGFLSPIGSESVAKPLEQYSFAALSRTTFGPSVITLTERLGSGRGYQTWKFLFVSEGKKISGTADFPVGVATTSALTSPVVILLHGFADAKEYYPGFGTERMAAELAKNGMVTFAPDFAGYGSSDPPDPDSFKDRFQTYTTVLTLISSLTARCGGECRLGLWGHSNGGQVALSVLEISRKNLPTALWNPVSRGFPYNILYYTDSFEDHGKWLRKALSKFEESYNVEEFSTPNFFDWIYAPILLQQGEADEWVPRKWSDELYQGLKDRDKNVTYRVYPGADHNLQPAWTTAAGETVAFYRTHL